MAFSICAVGRPAVGRAVLKEFLVVVLIKYRINRVSLTQSVACAPRLGRGAIQRNPPLPPPPPQPAPCAPRPGRGAIQRNPRVAPGRRQRREAAAQLPILSISLGLFCLPSIDRHHDGGGGVRGGVGAELLIKGGRTICRLVSERWPGRATADAVQRLVMSTRTDTH